MTQSLVTTYHPNGRGDMEFQLVITFQRYCWCIGFQKATPIQFFARTIYTLSPTFLNPKNHSEPLRQVFIAETYMGMQADTSRSRGEGSCR
jgi:hypothetical protein